MKFVFFWLSVFGAMQTAQCKRRNANGGLGLGLGFVIALRCAICIEPFALRRIQKAVFFRFRRTDKMDSVMKERPSLRPELWI